MMKTQKIIGTALLICSIATVWLLGYGAGMVGYITGSSAVIILISMLLLAVTPLRKKITLLFIVGSAFFISTGLALL